MVNGVSSKISTDSETNSGRICLILNLSNTKICLLYTFLFDNQNRTLAMCGETSRRSVAFLQKGMKKS